MSRVSSFVRRIHWGKLAAGIATVASSGAVSAAFPQYAPIIAVVGALATLATNPMQPEAPTP